MRQTQFFQPCSCPWAWKNVCVALGGTRSLVFLPWLMSWNPFHKSNIMTLSCSEVFRWETQFRYWAFAFCHVLTYGIFWKTAVSDLQTPHGRIKFKGYGVILSLNLEGENSSTPKPHLVQCSFSREKQRFLTRVLLLWCSVFVLLLLMMVTCSFFSAKLSSLPFLWVQVHKARRNCVDSSILFTWYSSTGISFAQN